MNTRLSILWCAARMVPRRERAEWLAEWTAEFWYVREQGGPTAGFCWGAFQDAWWLRRNRPPALRLETPLECLGWLGLIAALCALFGFAIPGARRVLLPFPYRGVGNLVALSPVRQIGMPAMTVGGYRNLAGQGLPFEGLAFYRVVRTRVGAREDLPSAGLGEPVSAPGHANTASARICPGPTGFLAAPGGCRCGAVRRQRHRGPP